MRELFTLDTEPVGMVEVACCDDDRPSMPRSAHSLDDEGIILFTDTVNTRVELERYTQTLCNDAIVLECFLARGTNVRRGKWHSAEFKLLGCGEKRHVHWKAPNRIADAAFVKNETL